MTILTVTLFTLFCALLLVLTGWLLAQRFGRTAKAAPISRYDVAASLRLADVARLRQLRVEIETGGDFNTEAVCLLFDTCKALGFDQAQTQHVVGPAFWLVLNTPVGDPFTEDEKK